MKLHRHTEMPRAPSQSTCRMRLKMLGRTPGESQQSLRQPCAFSALSSALSKPLTTSPSQWTLHHWHWTLQENIIISLTDPCLQEGWVRVWTAGSPKFKGNQQADASSVVGIRIDFLREVKRNQLSLRSLPIAFSIHGQMIPVIGT